MAEEKFSTCHWSGTQGELLGGTIKQLMGKFKVEEGMFFKAITGLANGVYGIKLTQFDSNNRPLFSSDVMFFVIR